MEVGKTDYGNKVQGISMNAVRVCFGEDFEPVDFFRVCNSSGCPIATYLVENE